jgi:hypothetical protein
VKTDTHPEIRRYLLAVDREAAALPADRRAELLDDLAEHIEVSLTERPGAIPEILAELGDPRDIAATALQEHGPVTPDRGKGGNPRTALGLLSVGSALTLLSHLPDQDWAGNLGGVLNLLGVIALCRNAWWSTTRKWQAVAALILPNLALQGLIELAGEGAVTVTVGAILQAVIRVGVLTWLWQSRVEPRGRWRVPIPRWFAVLFWCVLGACVIVAALGVFFYASLSGSIVQAP